MITEERIVLTYICEEVRRQGHDLAVEDDGGRRVAGMWDAWEFALGTSNAGLPVTSAAIKRIGTLIESINAGDFRRVPVQIGWDVRTAERLDERINDLLRAWDRLEPLELYREFEMIHPFLDGNGRTGKILLNWRNGTLLKPIFPPRGFWGREIVNP